MSKPLFTLASILVFGLVSISPLTAQDIIWRVAPEPIPDVPAYLAARALERGQAVASLQAREAVAGALIPREAEPSDFIFLPSYQVDTTSASGETTLYAVKNTGPLSEMIQIEYFDRSLNLLRSEMRNVASRALFTVNLRDVAQVTAAAEIDGFARGAIRITSANPVIEGDFFQVNPGQNFATGERLAEVDDFCESWGIRFLNGGAFTGGTDYRFLVNIPQGGDPNTDDPTFITSVFDEGGGLLATLFGYTDLFVNEDTAANIVGNLATSGSLEIFIDDAGTTGGLTMGNFSATGRFSVGLNGVCLPTKL